jgi:hypothetical protein
MDVRAVLQQRDDHLHVPSACRQVQRAPSTISLHLDVST